MIDAEGITRPGPGAVICEPMDPPRPLMYWTQDGWLPIQPAT